MTEPGDVVYCGCFGRYGTAGHYPHFDTACFRASRQVYEATSQPWFDFGYDETLTQKTRCECARFAQRLASLSLDGRPVVPLQMGVIGRLTQVVLIPAVPGCLRIVSPHEMPVGNV